MMNENRIMRKGAVREMNRYWLHAASGELSLARDNGKNIEKESEPQIILLNMEEFQQLEGNYPHRKNLISSMRFIRYSKVEAFHECVQGIIHVPKQGSKKEKEFSFGFYLFENKLFLIEEDEELQEILAKVKNDMFDGCTLHMVLLFICNALIDNDILYLQKIEENLEKVEDVVIKRIPEHFNEVIMRYRKQLSESRAYYEQLMNMGDFMQMYMNRESLVEEEQGWERYMNRVERLHNYVETIREYLQQIREMYQTQIDIHQNRIMSIPTIVTTLFLPLTLITGLYGMNFPGMPEFQWKYGYLAVIGVSVLLIIIEIVYFKKKRIWISSKDVI